ncbi:MAG TPA: RimK family alpha-L-glutamate ligase [Methanoregulaceae archaeon]|nr:RimK family alpha-L-glutamate ligase [Methanoregulaceae archaeon]
MIQVIPKPTDTPDDDSTRMVTDALDALGADWTRLDLDQVDPFASPLKGAVIWACGLRQDGHQFETLQALATRNRVVNPPHAIATCASKVATTALLIRAGLPSPATGFLRTRDQAGAFIGAHGGRAVFKPVYGFDGNGIRLVESPDDLGDPPYYLQEYLPCGEDYRVFVIGGEAVGAIRRRSPHLTHNIHQGGSGEAVRVTPEMSALAVTAARAVGADYAGVDLLPTQGGFTVLEVNGTPNWHCMTAPIPRLIAEYLVRCEEEAAGSTPRR